MQNVRHAQTAQLTRRRCNPIPWPFFSGIESVAKAVVMSNSSFWRFEANEAGV